MTDVINACDDRMSDRIAEQIQFGLIFISSFVVFAAAASVALLLPWTWMRRFRSDDKRWFIERAWDDANTFTELSFMG
jgi:predicted permease